MHGWAMKCLVRADEELEQGQIAEEFLDALSEALEDDTVRNRLHDLIHSLAHGHDVAITVMDEDLTTTQAAERLGVSRKILSKMIEAGELKSYQLPQSTHRRIPAGEVMRVLRERDEDFWSPLTDLPSKEAFQTALEESRSRRELAARR